MDIVFISNFMSHHQLPLSEELIRNNKDGSYIFIATQPINEERIKLGYADINECYDFILCEYASEENHHKAEILLDSADVVIWGSADYEMLRKRLQSGKLTFRYSERIFRTGKYSLIKPSNRKKFYEIYGQYASKDFYLLSAGAYAPIDYRLINAFPNKMFKWGYFPPFEKNKFSMLQKLKEKESVEIVWCARFLRLKHPEAVLFLAKYLQKKRLNFHITMIGDGPLFEKIKERVFIERLNRYIQLTGSIQADMVRSYMDNASILLFTSDSREGWGAVMNEGMNSACVPIVSHEIGSAPFLIEHGRNGFVFKSRDWKDLSRYVEKLIINRKLLATMSNNAYLTIENVWNAEKAAQNFILLCTALLNDKNIPMFVGPCSYAEEISPKDVITKIRKSKE